MHVDSLLSISGGFYLEFYQSSVFRHWKSLATLETYAYRPAAFEGKTPRTACLKAPATCGDFPLLPHRPVLRLASADTKCSASAELQSLCEVSLPWLPEQEGGGFYTACPNALGRNILTAAFHRQTSKDEPRSSTRSLPCAILGVVICKPTVWGDCLRVWGKISYVTLNQRGEYTTKEVSLCCRWLNIYNIYVEGEKTKPFKTASLLFFICGYVAHNLLLCISGQSARHRECTSRLACSCGSSTERGITIPKSSAAYCSAGWWCRPGRRADVTPPRLGLTTPPTATVATIRKHHLRQRKKTSAHTVTVRSFVLFQRSVASWPKHRVNHKRGSVCLAHRASTFFFVIASCPSIIYLPNNNKTLLK